MNVIHTETYLDRSVLELIVTSVGHKAANLLEPRLVNERDGNTLEKSLQLHKLLRLMVEDCPRLSR
jgi:hypothetical protein